jgi:AcrR family transcriptional regulator
MPKGIPLTEEQIDRRRREIFRSAVDLIFKQGFAATSMQTIAKAAGVGKSTLYDYFPTKSHVLLFVFEEELERLQELAEEIIAQPIPVEQKLTRILEVHLEFLINNQHINREVSLQAMHLERLGQRRILKKRYAYQDLLRGIVEQGVREGVFRPVNPRLTARLLISMVEVLVYTTRPTGTPQAMLSDALEIFMNGIKPLRLAGLES